MAVLNNLLKNRHEPDTAAGREAALNGMSPDELAACADNPRQPAELREAAVERLPYGEPLKRLAFEGAASRVQRVARRRIARLIDDGSLSVEQLRSDGPDTVAVLSVLGLSDRDGLLEQFLDSLDDPALLSRLAVEGEPVALRRLAAERVEDPATLHRLLKDAKGRDKTVFRVVKHKVDAIKDEEKQQDEARAAAERLCAAAERHSRLPFDSHYAGRIDDLENQWRQLGAGVPDHLTDRFGQAVSVCRGKVEEQERIAREQARRQQALDEEAAARGALQQELQKLLASVYTADVVDEALEASTRSRLEAVREQWRGRQEHGPAGAGEAKTFERLGEAVESAVEQLKAHGPLQAHLEASDEAGDQRVLKRLLKPAQWLADDQVPEIVKTANQAVREHERARKEYKEAEQRRIRSLGGLLRKADSAVNAGRVRQAFGIRKSIENKLRQIENLPPPLARQLENLDAGLEKLQDWRDYAVQPKKEALIEQMESLIGAEMNPEALAGQIKTLQEQWRDVCKGGQDEHPELWERFHQAAEQAYAPCRRYFEQRAELRRQNLEKRKQLVEQLKTYYEAQDWADPDWKAVEKVLHTALADWRKCSPVNRSEVRPVQAEFDKAVEAIRAQLAHEYDKNIGAKQALIQRAEKIAGQDDARQAAEEIKALQAQWKQVGITPRREDRKLWKAFRKHCDTVFEKLDQASAEFKAELDSQREKAEGLCREAEALSERTGRSLMDARSELEQLREAFGQIHNLPRSADKKIRERFRRAADKFDKRVARERQAARVQKWTHLLAAADAVRQYELALTDNADADSALDAARGLIEQTDDWPADGRRIVEQRLDNARALSDDELQANETELRRLCIRAEILAGRESPPQDKDMRMQYQLEQLQQGFGQGAAGNADIDSLTLEWAGVGAVRSGVYNELLERFNACRRMGS